MISEILEIETVNGSQPHVFITYEDGSGKSFPADEANPEYVAWLDSQTPTTPKK
jgi:hypothetical protein